MNKHVKFVFAETIVLVFVILLIYFVYPKTEASVNNGFVKFSNINANVIAISKNSDFSNSRYVEINDSLSLNLAPGEYYWKSSNGLIESFSHEFTIDSKVDMAINRTENNSELVNAGNVVINVSKNSNGVLVGRVVLGPDESQKIEDKNETYAGGQA